MKKFLSVLPAVVAVFFLFIGSTTVKKISPSEVRKTKSVKMEKPINAITMRRFIDLVYIQDNSVSITVDAPANMLKYVDVVNINGNLNVDINVLNLVVVGECKITVYVYAPDVHIFHLFGSGDMIINGDLTKFNKFSLETTMSGDVHIPGKLLARDEISMQTQGSGNIFVNELQSKGFVARSLGSGDIVVNAAELTYMALHDTGSGNINILSGSASRGELNLTGSGSMDLSGMILSKFNMTSKGTGKINIPKDIEITGPSSLICD